MRKFLIGMFMACALTFIPCKASPISDLNAMKAEMSDILLNLIVLDDSEKKTMQSETDQRRILVSLDKIQDKIEAQDGPALIARATKLNEWRQLIIDTGCPIDGSPCPIELQAKCNSEISGYQAAYKQLMEETDTVKAQYLQVQTDRQAVSNALAKNFIIRQENANLRAKVETKKLELGSAMILKVLKIPGRSAKAMQMCATILDSYISRCCLSVINDDKNPQNCGVWVIYTHFKQGGVFNN